MSLNNEISPWGEAPLGDEELALATEVFTLLADPTRIRLILLLRDTERSSGELAAMTGRSPAAISQHLAKLRWGHVVASRQEGSRVYYRLTDEHALALVEQALYQAEHVVDEVPAHHRSQEPVRS
jgi:transcriptional regulator, arsR family